MNSRTKFNYEINTVNIGAFVLESGEVLTGVEVAYERTGNLYGPTILVCHALTGNQFTVGTVEEPGWWSGLIGPEQIIDTHHFQIITFNVLGGCNGSTGPTTINPQTRKRYQGDFPYPTVRDLVHVQKKALDQLGISSLHAVIGGSLGGMQVMEWGILYPSFMKHLIVLASTPEMSDYGMAFNRIAIEAIQNDSEWKGGYYDASSQIKGLDIARMVGMVTYRTPKLFTNRFNREVKTMGYPTEYQVDSYLNYQGEKLRNRFDANSYLRLLYTMNSHDIGRGRGGWKEAASQITASVLCLAYRGDLLYESTRIQEFADEVPNGKFIEVDTIFGHDGFLVEYEKWGPLLREELETRKGEDD